MSANTTTTNGTAKAFIEFTLPDGRIMRQAIPTATARRVSNAARARTGKTTPTASQLRALYEQYGFAHQSVIIAAHQEQFPEAAANERELSAGDVNETLDALALASENRRMLVQPDSTFSDEDFALTDVNGDALERDCPATVKYLTFQALALALKHMADASVIHRVPTGRTNKAGESGTMKGYYSFYPAVRRTAAELRNEALAGDDATGDSDFDADDDFEPVARAMPDCDSVDDDVPAAKPAKTAKKVSRK
jgi:hypothetical protein